jgi:hypothetical protein
MQQACRSLLDHASKVRARRAGSCGHKQELAVGTSVLVRSRFAMHALQPAVTKLLFHSFFVYNGRT